MQAPRPLGSELPARAGVSSFGFGGTNVHAVLEAASEPDTRESDQERPELVLLSAPTRDLLAPYAGTVAGLSRADPARSVAAVAAELATRRCARTGSPSSRPPAATCSAR